MNRFRARLARFPRPVRWLVWVVVALVGWEVIYVVTANVVLATHLVDRMVNASAPDVEMHVNSGWTVWPGYVHVKDVTILVNDSDLQAMLYVEEATANVTLWSFLDRKLEIHGAHANGLKFWMRHRVAAITDDIRERVAAFAPIPGMEPPIFDPVKRALPKPPKEKMWRFEIHDGSAEGGEFWLQELHYVGPLRGTGGFYFWPLAEMTLYPIRGAADGGEVRIGDTTIARNVNVHVQASLGRFVMPDQKGLEQLRGLDGHATMSVDMADGDVMKAYEPSGLPKTWFTDGRFVAWLDFHDKHFTETTKTLFTGTLRSIPKAGISVQGPVQVTGIGKPDGMIEAGFDTAGMQVHLSSLKSTAKAPWKLAKTSLRAAVQLELDKPIVLTIAAMQGHLSIPDLDWVAQLTDGSLSAQGKIESDLAMKKNSKGDVVGTVETTLDDVRISAKSLATAVAGTVKTSFAAKISSASAEQVSLGEVSLDLPQLTLRAGSRARTTWLKASLPSLHFVQKPSPLLQSEIQVELGDSSILALPVEEQGPFAELAAKWLFKGGASLRGALEASPPDWDFSLERGRVGLVDAKGFVGAHGPAKRGAFWVSAQGFSAGIRVEGDVASVSPLVGEGWLQEQRTVPAR